MHRENHFYGHAEALRRYVGLDRPRPIPGYIQHGWQHGTGVVPDCAKVRWPKLVWSRRNLDACVREGVRNPRPIGAPFLYLPPVDDPGPGKGDRSLLAVPYHGWAASGVLAVREAYTSYAASLANLPRDGFGDITVCMFWLEYEDPALRDIFEREGFGVVTAGEGRTDTGFLLNLRDMILDHGHVTSNRIATATFYALALNRPFFRLGPSMGLGAKGSPAGDTVEERERKEFPSLLFESYEGRVEAEIAARELGAEYRLEPEALREALGWAPAGVLTHVGRGLEMNAWCLSRGLWRTVRGLVRRPRTEHE